MRNFLRWRIRLLVVPIFSFWRAVVMPKWRQTKGDVLQRLSFRAPRVLVFYDTNDAYSALLAQVLPRLCAAYRVQIKFHLVSPMTADMAPERKKLDLWALQDAQDIAPFYGLTTPAKQPSTEAQKAATRALIAAGDDVDKITAISAALWSGNSKALAGFEAAPAGATKEALKAGTQLRNKLGHYNGAMLFYRGIWYWGIDRLPYLLTRLARFKRADAKKVFPRKPQTIRLNFPRPTKRFAKKDRNRTPAFQLECFLSLRSPYSYVAMPDIISLARRYDVAIVPRPVLPMIMRGLPVPLRKGGYIMFDTAREAHTHSVPFLPMQDPVGKPVERGMSLFPLATEKGKGLEWLHAFCQLAWSQKRDMSRTKNLQRAWESIDLDWADTELHLDSSHWRDVVEANQTALSQAGLWGVPSFRLLNTQKKQVYAGWGRDRIWRLTYLLAGITPKATKS